MRTRLVKMFVDAFDDRALEIARSQRDAADGGARAEWAAIVEEIEDLS